MMFNVKKYSREEAEREINRIIDEFAEKLRYAEPDEKRFLCEVRDREIYCVEINTVG